MPDNVYDYVTSTVDTGEACKARRSVKVIQCHLDGSRATRRRQKANVRERSRMRSINAAYDRLRALLPGCRRSSGRHERCGPSKVETLRLAVAYISCLTRLVRSVDHQSPPLSPRDDRHSGRLASVLVIQSRARRQTHGLSLSCFVDIPAYFLYRT